MGYDDTTKLDLGNLSFITLKPIKIKIYLKQLTFIKEPILYTSFCKCLHSLSFLSFSFNRLALSLSSYINLSLNCSFSPLACSRSCSINLYVSAFIYTSLLALSNSLCMLLIFCSCIDVLCLKSSKICSLSCLLYLASFSSCFNCSSVTE